MRRAWEERGERAIAARAPQQEEAWESGGGEQAERERAMKAHSEHIGAVAL